MSYELWLIYQRRTGRTSTILRQHHMKVESIKRSGIILGLGGGFALCFYPIILYVLIAIDLLLCAITLFLCARVEASGVDRSNHSVHTATQSRAVKKDTNL